MDPSMATDLAATERPNSSINLVRRAVRVVGDILWWSFLFVIFASITVGVATELFW
jgi:hypothetical protein